jgi:hypothetical protein
MRILAATALTASLLASGCASNTYRISGPELQRLAELPPEQRGQSVRVVQQLSNINVGAPQPITGETQIVLFPQINVYEGGRPMHGGGWGRPVGTPIPRSSGGGGGGALHGFSGGGGDGKAMAIAALVFAVAAVVAVGAIEGTRYDGYVKLHPMHPLWLYGHDGTRAVLPLAQLDPQSAAFSDFAYVRDTEGPWHPLGRAPLDRQGLTYAVLFGAGTFQSADGSKRLGTGSTIQLGYYITQQFGIVGSVYFGWRDNDEAQTLFESRYTLEAQGYPVAVGPLHLGLFGGGGAAYRFEDGVVGGDSGSLALMGGALAQLDINTRLALTARVGQTYAHGERMSDALFGLSVY